MSLLIARFWPIAKRCAIGHQQRSLRLHKVWISPGHRQYATSSRREQRKLSSHALSPHSAVIIPASVKKTVAELTDRIKPLNPDQQASRNLCVIFVTPAFANWLSKDNAFLGQFINRLYGPGSVDGQSQTSELEVKAVCAVVHALPTAVGDGAKSISLGYEGIAYTTLPKGSNSSIPKRSSSQAGMVEFLVQNQASGDDILTNTIRIPLANTVFQTGTQTTLFEATWERKSTENAFTLVARQDAIYQRLSMVHFHGPGPRSGSNWSLSIPLLPLTVPRKVEGCMGNIVRRIIGADEKSVTASMELESVVPRFFKARGEPAQTTAAWALVIPREMKDTIIKRTNKLIADNVARGGEPSSADPNSWDSLWQNTPAIWNEFVSQAVTGGARLHRVLSGGGGWGKKAGILSLDPVPSVGTTQENGVLDVQGGDPIDFESTLTPVTRDGDFIQFFITPSSDLVQQASKNDNEGELQGIYDSSGELGASIQLGTVPSTMDSIPGQSWQHSPTASGNVFVFQQAFGALVEGGLSFTQSQEQTEKGKPPVSSVQHISMIDVPFSRFLTYPRSKTQEEMIDRTRRPCKQTLAAQKLVRFFNLERRRSFKVVASLQKQYDSIQAKIIQRIQNILPSHEHLAISTSLPIRIKQGIKGQKLQDFNRQDAVPLASSRTMFSIPSYSEKGQDDSHSGPSKIVRKVAGRKGLSLRIAAVDTYKSEAVLGQWYKQTRQILDKIRSRQRKAWELRLLARRVAMIEGNIHRLRRNVREIAFIVKSRQSRIRRFMFQSPSFLDHVIHVTEHTNLRLHRFARRAQGLISVMQKQRSGDLSAIQTKVFTYSATKYLLNEVPWASFKETAKIARVLKSMLKKEGAIKWKRRNRIIGVRSLIRFHDTLPIKKVPTSMSRPTPSQSTNAKSIRKRGRQERRSGKSKRKNFVRLYASLPPIEYRILASQGRSRADSIPLKDIRYKRKTLSQKYVREGWGRVHRDQIGRGRRVGRRGVNEHYVRNQNSLIESVQGWLDTGSKK